MFAEGSVSVLCVIAGNSLSHKEPYRMCITFAGSLAERASGCNPAVYREHADQPINNFDKEIPIDGQPNPETIW